jgi:PAS domain S-box-containing protein
MRIKSQKLKLFLELDNKTALKYFKKKLVIKITEQKSYKKNSINLREKELEIDYHDFYNFTPAGYFILNINGIILNVNSKGAALLGIEKSNIIQKEFIKFVNLRFHDQYRSICNNAVKTGLNHQGELKLIKDGNSFWTQIEIIFKKDENRYKMSLIDINERKEVERALLENERKFRISLETLLDAFAIFSTVRENDAISDFKFEYINEVGCKLNQKTYGEQVGYNLLEILPEHKNSGLFQEYVEVVETGIPLVKESFIYEDAFGKRKLFKAYDIRAVKLGDGFAVTWRDVTKRKKAEKKIKKSLEEKEILLKEIHHRIKNNMQVISSLLGLQSLYVKDKNSINILKESQERVKSMAIVHEKLYGSKDFTKINFKEYTKEISLHLLNSFDAHDINFKVKGKDLFLGLDTAIPCGLIINELITNSIKYAFPTTVGHESKNREFPNTKNEIHRSIDDSSVNTPNECLETTTDIFESSDMQYRYKKSDNLKDEICINLNSNENELTIKVMDNGIGIHDDRNLENNDTLGFLIVTTLVNQIQGNIRMISSKGTTFEIKFPNPI